MLRGLELEHLRIPRRLGAALAAAIVLAVASPSFATEDDVQDTPPPCSFVVEKAQFTDVVADGSSVRMEVRVAVRSAV